MVTPIGGLLADYMIWLVLILYAGCFVPQIYTNYKMKSAEGFSSGALLSFFVAYVLLLFYTFLMDLYFPYKVIAPIQFTGAVLLVAQRFHYHGVWDSKPFLYTVFGTIALAFAVLPLTFFYPLLIGKVAGWLAVVCFSIRPIPQVIKVYKEKSVEGFSLGFVTILGFAAVCEAVVALLKGLPAQTFLMALKCVIIYLITCFQFFLYNRKRMRKRIVLTMASPSLLILPLAYIKFF